MPLPALLVQTVREIDKSVVIEGGGIVIHDATGDPISRDQEQGMKAGDFYFRSNTVTHYENASWFRRVILRQAQTLVVEHPETIVLSCPYCGLPLMSQIDNKILSRSPLTLDKSIRCPFGMYDAAHAFQIKDGKIMPA